MNEKTEQERQEEIRNKYRKINDSALLVETLTREFEDDMTLFYRVLDTMLSRLTKVGKADLAQGIKGLDQWPNERSIR
jgi:hypothetical protein